MLDVGVIAYMDDILIYSETIEEHVAMVRKVMDTAEGRPMCQHKKVNLPCERCRIPWIQDLSPWKINDNQEG